MADRLLVGSFRAFTVVEQGGAAGTNTQRLRRADGESTLRQDVKGGHCLAALAAASGGLDQLRQCHLRDIRDIVLHDSSRGTDRRMIIAGPHVSHGGDGPANVGDAALAARS